MHAPYGSALAAIIKCQSSFSPLELEILLGYLTSNRHQMATEM